MNHPGGPGANNAAPADLAGRAVLITGGGTGIGKAMALAFAAAGARVMVAGRRSEPLQETVREIRASGGVAAMAKGDVSKPDSVELIVNSVVYNFERLDVLVNNAAIFFPGPIDATTERRWDRTINTNLKGTFLMSQLAVPAMRKGGGGVIINIAATEGVAGTRNAAAYAASKGGVIALTRAMAVDHAGERIRVVAICPGMVDSPFIEARRRSAGEGFVEPDTGSSVMGRAALPSDVAGLAIYLASDESSWITGSVFHVNPGRAAT